ncbi:MAG: hypothetical protein O7G84_11745 [Gammaproteobacteria bacterium]|nr:hypothetical protein [Gammaproteobacteria bacterium]
MATDPLPKMTPMRLTQQAKPFDHPEWLFEVKFDGFRALPASTVSVS